MFLFFVLMKLAQKYNFLQTRTTVGLTVSDDLFNFKNFFLINLIARVCPHRC